jgi:predicted HTH transcriptional regulator
MELEKDTKYIKNLIKQGEHQKLDFKYAINDSKKIARSLSAFANTEGGTLLIGVKDNGAIVGVSSEEEYYMVEAASNMYTKPEVQFNAKIWEVADKTVMEVVVGKSSEKPHYAPDKDNKWKAYIRIKDQNIVANRILVKVWKNKKNERQIKIKYSRKEELLLSYLSEFKSITFSKFYKLAQISKLKAENILADFIILGIIEMKISEKQAEYILKQKIELDL